MANELDVKHRVEKRKNTYVHNIKVKYPNENVKNMTEGWEKTIKEFNEWLDGYNEMVNTTIDMGLKKLDETLEQQKKQYEEFETYNNEQKLKKLLDEYAKERKEFEEKLQNKDELILEYKKGVYDEFEKSKSEITKKKEELSAALKLWKNPVIKN